MRIDRVLSRGYRTYTVWDMRQNEETVSRDMDCMCSQCSILRNFQCESL